MQFVDLPQRQAALPVDAVQRRLRLEERQRTLDERCRPQRTDERRRREGVAGPSHVEHRLVDPRDRLVRPVGRVRQRRPSTHWVEPVREIVGQRRRLAGQFTQVHGIAQERGADLLRPLERHLAQARLQSRRLPRRGELFHRAWARQTARADQHQVERRGIPERAVAEHVAEGADDRVHVGARMRPRHRQPVGNQPAVGQPVVHQLEVLAGVDVHRARCARRWRLAGDQIEPLAGGLQEEAAVLEVQADTRVVQRSRACGVDGIAHRDDIRRDLGDVDLLHRRDVRHRADGDADAVADNQRLAQRAVVQQHRVVRERPHVTLPLQGRARHREAVGNQTAVDRLPQPLLLHHEERFRDPLPRRYHPRAIVGIRRGGTSKVATVQCAERKGRRSQHQRSGSHHPQATGRAARRQQRHQAIRHANAKDGSLHANVRQQHPGRHRRSADGAGGVRQRQPAGRCGSVIGRARQRLTDQREQRAGQARHRQREHHGEPEHGRPLTDLCAGRQAAEQHVTPERGESRRTRHGRQQVADVGAAPQPGRRQESAQADAAQHHGQHQAGGQRCDQHVHRQEAEPHHLERQQQRTRQRGGQIERRARTGRARFVDDDLNDRCGHGCRAQRQCGGSKVQQRRHPRTAGDADRADQHHLGHHHTGHCTERVPAVQPAKRDGEACALRAERRHQHRHRGAHRGRRNEKDGKGDQEPQHVQHSAAAGHRDQHRSRLRQQVGDDDAREGDQHFKGGVDTQGVRDATAACGHRRTAQRETGHEAGQHDGHRGHAAPEHQAAAIEPRHLEDQAGGTGEEEGGRQRERRKHRGK